MKRKCGRLSKQKLERDLIPKTAANTHTTQPWQATKNSKNEIISRDLIDKVNVEHEKSDRLTIVRLDAIVKGNKQNYKSNLMTEKYSLLPAQSHPLTPVQTALQWLSEKHPDFEIQPINTIRPPEVEYTQRPQALMPTDAPLSIIRKHISWQSDLDKIVKSIESHVIHGLELPIQAQDLIKAYQTSTHFWDVYHYITDGKLPCSTKAQGFIWAEALNYCSYQQLSV